MTDWIIIGGGMRGIFAAINLLKNGQKVVVIEGASHMGGIMYSREWNDFYIDKGCHLLDFGSVEAARIYDEILGEEKLPVNRRYASINRGIKSDAIAVPDLSRFEKDERKLCLQELEASASNTELLQYDSLLTLLIHRYGNSAGKYVAEAVKKICGHDPSGLAPEALHSLPVERIRLGDDDEMEKLKTKPELDERLAVSSERNPLRFYENQTEFPHRNYYPAKKGMRGFCEAAQRYLLELGAEIITDCPVESLEISDNGVTVLSGENQYKAKRCYWSLPPVFFNRIMGQENPWLGATKPVSLVIYTFKVPRTSLGPYTYIHDFSDNTISYRISSPGDYGNQVDKEGKTYVTVEVPTTKESDTWNDPQGQVESIWAEVGRSGMIEGELEVPDNHIEALPVGYSIPACGWSDAVSKFNSMVEAYKPVMVFPNIQMFGKSDMCSSVRSELGV